MSIEITHEPRECETEKELQGTEERRTTRDIHRQQHSHKMMVLFI